MKTILVRVDSVMHGCDETSWTVMSTAMAAGAVAWRMASGVAGSGAERVKVSVWSLTTSEETEVGELLASLCERAPDACRELDS